MDPAGLPPADRNHDAEALPRATHGRGRHRDLRRHITNSTPDRAVHLQIKGGGSQREFEIL
jgi:hypothetical protein